MGGMFSSCSESPSHERSLSTSAINNSKNVISNEDKAILDLKLARDRVLKYRKKLELVILKEREMAIQCLKLTPPNKIKAALFLKRKRYQETLLDKTDGELQNVKTMIDQIEFSKVEVEVIKGLKIGNAALAVLQEQLKIEDVEKLMDDSAEAIAYQNEISNMLSGNMNSEDEDAILRELEELQVEDLLDVNEQLPSVPSANPNAVADELPSIPPVKVANKTKKISQPLEV